MIASFESLEFYRGVTGTVVAESPTVRKVRPNRLPRNMPPAIHQRADLWFERKFGIRYRSQALFVTSSVFVANNYAVPAGNVVRIIPTGPYKYCWSPVRKDLLFYCSVAPDVSIEDYLEQGNYIDSDLLAAHVSGNEVMLFCENYISIPIESNTHASEQLTTGNIILL